MRGHRLTIIILSVLLVGACSSNGVKPDAAIDGGLGDQAVDIPTTDGGIPVLPDGSLPPTISSKDN